jgi:hypothetical protein
LKIFQEQAIQSNQQLVSWSSVHSGKTIHSV